MVEVADVFRLHGPQYRAQFGARMLPSHRRAMQDIEQRRTLSALATTLFASTKKTSPAAGLLHFTLTITFLAAYSFFPPAFKLTLRSFKLTLQTPSSP
jgi:hypothetical protein